MLCAPDDSSLCQAQLGLADALRVNEGLAEALTILDKAQAIAGRNQMIPELARLHHLRGNIYFPMGDIAGCRREHEEGLGYAQRTGSAEAEARALGGLADAAYAEGRMRSAFEFFSRCVAISRSTDLGASRSPTVPWWASAASTSTRRAKPAKMAMRRSAQQLQSVSQEPSSWVKTMGMFATLERGDGAGVQGYLDRGATSRSSSEPAGSRPSASNSKAGFCWTRPAGRTPRGCCVNRSNFAGRSGRSSAAPWSPVHWPSRWMIHASGEHALRRGKPCSPGVRSATTTCGSIATPLKSCSMRGSRRSAALCGGSRGLLQQRAAPLCNPVQSARAGPRGTAGRPKQPFSDKA